MVYYKIGCNFDMDLLYGVCKLNEINDEVQINEFYGSDRSHAALTARPDFRLPDVSKSFFEDYIHRCNEAGIRFNYTLNTPYPGSKKELTHKKDKIMDFIKYLEDIGVSMVMVAHPLMAEMVRKASSNIGIEVSTIAHIDAITQIKAWKDKYGIEKVCNNLLKNRSIKFLESAASYCNRNGIILDLMVNEFCGNGGRTDEYIYGTHCIYRDSCYLCHAENVTEEDANLLNGYPMRDCINSRTEAAIWLKMRFIRPEDIDKYVGIGINHFKITGRTAGADYILKIAEAYIRKSWDGNLLSLWKQLETIYTKVNENENKQPIFIDNKKLSGFIDYWFDNPEHECANEACGETCIYCDLFYEQSVSPESMLATRTNGGI